MSLDFLYIYKIHTELQSHYHEAQPAVNTVNALDFVPNHRLDLACLDPRCVNSVRSDVVLQRSR